MSSRIFQPNVSLRTGDLDLKDKGTPIKNILTDLPIEQKDKNTLINKEDLANALLSPIIPNHEMRELSVQVDSLQQREIRLLIKERIRLI